MESLNYKNIDIVKQYCEDVKNKNQTSYMLTIARDGEEPARSIYFYTDAIKAAEGYNAYSDWGFSKEYLTVELFEPSGKKTSKVIHRIKGGDCSFVRQNYYDVSAALLKIKNFVPDNYYNDLVYDISLIFAKDNERFDSIRFFKNAECIGLTNE
jgi:hypothetical protein